MPVLAAAGLLAAVWILSVAFVAAGHVFTAADLTEVSAAADPAIRLIPATEATQVVGKAAAVPLLAGMLLTRAMVGPVAFPPAGQVVSSLALKPGQYPHRLQPGAHVDVFVISDSSPTGAQGDGSPKAIPAVVLAVDLGGDGQGNTVVTILVDQPDAARLAGVGSGRVILMQTAPGGV